MEELVGATSTVPGESSEQRPASPRLHPRFPIELPLQYKLITRGRIQQFGRGRTVNISSGGVLFAPEDGSQVKARVGSSDVIELVMDWPLLLREVCALKLVVRGEIVRHDGERCAMRVERYEFRTAGRRAVPPAEQASS